MSAHHFGRAGVLAVAVALAFPAAAQQVTFMTGPQGGSWIPLGGALKNMWEAAVPGLQIQQQPGAGIANVRGIDEGKAQIGFGNSSTTVDGVEGRPPYPKKASRVCQVANLYPQYFQVVALADAKVGSFADLKGKTLVTQPKGNTAELLTSRGAEDQRHELQLAQQGELPGVVHRRRRHDEGRPRPGVHAGNHGAGFGGDGPRERARRAAWFQSTRRR